jgi:uncharacterized protein YjbI with pentapeptide repeats
MIVDSSKTEVWRRLVTGESLGDLLLPKKEGRIDLSGLVLDNPRILEKWQTSLADVARIEPNAVFRNAKLENLDLTGSKLRSVHVMDCEIRNCCFDRCDMSGLKLSATTIHESSFRQANLRGIALGAASVTGPVAGRRNSFAGVDFSGADLRDTIYVAASFEHCNFSYAKLVNIKFGTSTFSDCKFAGELRQVQFWRSDLFARGFAVDAFPPNEMANVDFSRAVLRDVEFRGLTLDRVCFPGDTKHLVIRDFPNVLDRLIDALARQGDETARLLKVFLGAYRKWTVPGAIGVLNKQDLLEAGPDAVERVVGLLDQFAAKVQ